MNRLEEHHAPRSPGYLGERSPEREFGCPLKLLQLLRIVRYFDVTIADMARKRKEKTAESKAISGRISRQAYEIFRREQSNFGVPTGKLLEFMIDDFEEMGWAELEERVEEWRNDRRQKRLAYDRERKANERKTRC